MRLLRSLGLIALGVSWGGVQPKALAGQRPDPLTMSAVEIARAMDQGGPGHPGQPKAATEGLALYVLTRPSAYRADRLEPLLDTLEAWASGRRSPFLSSS